MNAFRFILICGVLALALTRASAEDAPFIGLWKVITSERGGKEEITQGAMEFEFLPDGVMLITGTDPERKLDHPIRMRWSYRYVQPDILTYTLKGDPVERQRFQIKGDKMYFEHLDYPIKAVLRRLTKTEFTEAPIETQEFPK